MKRRELLMDFAMGVIAFLNSQNSYYNFRIFLSTLLWTFEEVKPHILICFLEVLPTHFRTRIITFSCEQFFKVQSKSLRGIPSGRSITSKVLGSFFDLISWARSQNELHSIVKKNLCFLVFGLWSCIKHMREKNS